MHPLLINGIWVDACAGEAFDVRNPATLDIAGRVAAAGVQDISLAVAAARAAAAPWRALPVAMRTQLLTGVARRLRAEVDGLAALLVREGGRPLCEARDCVHAAAERFDRAGSATALAGGPMAPGVVAALPGAADPLLDMACQVAPALAIGHTVVCLAPGNAPLTVLKVAALFDTLPSGVINVVTGDSVAVDALAGHADLNAVLHSSDRPASAAAVPWVEIDADGEDRGPFVVCRDADLELAVPCIAWTLLHQTGQARRVSKLVYADNSILADLLAALHGYIGLLEVDDPQKPVTDIGPLCTLAAARRVEDQVMAALRERAMPVLGGRRVRPSGLPGHFFQPTILSGLSADSRLGHQAIAGPVVLAAGVAGLDAALCSAGAAGHRCASVLTRDVDAAVAAAERAGLPALSVNDPRRAAPGEANPAASAYDCAGALVRKPWWFPYAARR